MTFPPRCRRLHDDFSDFSIRSMITIATATTVAVTSNMRLIFFSFDMASFPEGQPKATRQALVFPL